jgi:hypothetical protein
VELGGDFSLAQRDADGALLTWGAPARTGHPAAAAAAAGASASAAATSAGATVAAAREAGAAAAIGGTGPVPVELEGFRETTALAACGGHTLVVVAPLAGVG